MHPRQFLSACALFLVIALRAVAADPDYVPNDSVLQKMTPLEARRFLRAKLGTPIVGWSDQDLFLASKVRILSQSIRFDGMNGALMTPEFTKVTPRVEMVKPSLGDGRIEIHFDGFPEKHYITYGNGKSDAAWFGFAKQVADAFWVIRRDIERDSEPQSDARFEQIAKDYQALNPKPELSEEQRKYMVQAGAALRDRDFDDSTDLFREVVRLAEWYPDAHFNLALSLGEKGEFDGAVRQMKRYLRLVPDASNARAAQDKIYEWERKVR